MLTDDQKFELAANPEKIVSQSDCNSISAFLLGHINDLTNKEWEARLISSQKKVQLLNDPSKTNAQAKAEWEVSEEYQKWQQTVSILRKFRAFRADVKDRFAVLMNLKRY
jgi:hypothetical protein